MAYIWRTATEPGTNYLLCDLESHAIDIHHLHQTGYYHVAWKHNSCTIVWRSSTPTFKALRARISTVKMCVKHANYSQNCATDKWRGRVEVVQGNTYLSLCTSHMFVNKTWLVQMACGLGGPSHGSVSINPAGYKCCLNKIWLCCICCLKNNNWTHKLKQHFLVWKVFACGLWSPDNQVSPPQLVAWSFMFQCMYLHN